MLFNKYTYRKANDKKLLHKIGKRWVTVSIAMLALLGGGMVASSTTHASANVAPNSRAQTMAVKRNINQQLQQKPQSNSGSVQNSQASGSNTSNIMNQAKAMHRNIVGNAPTNVSSSNAESSSANSASDESANNSESKPNASTPSKPESTNSNVGNSGSSNVGQQSSASASSASSSNASGNGMNTLKLGTPSQQAKGWNYVQHGIRHNDYDRTSVNKSRSSAVNNSASGDQITPVSAPSAKSSVGANASGNVKHGFGAMRLNAQDQSTPQATDTNWIYSNGKYISDNQAGQWKTNKDLNQQAYYGLNWKYNEANKAVEFTDGNLDYNDNNGFGSILNSNPLMANAHSVKFDNAVKTPKLHTMASMFQSDSNIQSIDFGSGFNVHNVSYMGQVFYGANNLKSIIFPSNFDTSNATNMHHMFYGDTNLSDIKNLNTFNTDKVTNMKSMFASNGIKSLDLSSFDTNNVTNMDSMFRQCNNLKFINFGNNFNTNNVVDMSNMFNSDLSLTSLTLPKTFNTNNVTDMSYMFFNDPNLQILNLQKPFNTSKVTNMDYMFTGDKSIQSLPISSFDTSNVTNMNSIFSDDKSVQSLNLPNTFNTSKITNMDQMFADMNSLKSLALPKSFDTSNVTSMKGMFVGEWNLKDLDLGPNFDTSNVNDMLSMFSDEHSLPNLYLGSKFDTSNVHVMAHMFDSDYSLQNLNLPNNFNTNKTSDMYMMFIRDGINNNKGINISLSPQFNTSSAINNNHAWSGDIAHKDNSNGLSDIFQFANINSINVPQDANFKLNAQANLKPLYQKDSNDNFTSATPYDFTKGNNVGVFENKNTPNVQETIAFYNQSNNNLISKTTINGNANTSYKLASTSSLIPKGYHLVNAQGNQVNSDTFTIDPNKFDNVEIKSNNPSTNTQANKDIPVAPTMVNDDITYSYKNKAGQTKTIANKTINGQTGTSAKSAVDNSSNMPNGYQPSGNSDAFDYPATKGSKTINIKPINKTEKVTYMNGSQKVASDTISGNDSSAQGASDTTFDPNSKMPNGYKLANGQSTKVNYDGNNHTVNVVVDATKQTANVNYKLPNGQIINGTVTGKNGSDVTPTAPQGYHFTGNPKKYHFDPKNAGNEPSDNNSNTNDLNIAPNTVKGTATIHINYNVSGHTYNGTDQKVNINGQYGDPDQMIYPVQYQPSNDDYSTTSQPLDINFNSIAKNGSNDSYNPSTTFTYNATEAPNLVIRYDDTTNHNNVVHSDTYTPSDLGIKPQDWVEGNTITLGTGNQGTSTNRGINVIHAPYGYHLEDNKSGFDYQNGEESITLEPNANVSGHPVILMAMPMFIHHGNKPVTPRKPTKPTSKASAKPSSASVAPSSEASSASSSVAPSNVSPDIVTPSSTTDSVSSASTSTESSSNVAPSVSSASQSNSKASIGSSAVSKIKSASSAKPVVHKISKKSVSAKHIESATPKAHVNKINKVNHRAVSEASNMPTKAVQANSTNSVESGHQVATFEVHKANNNAPYVVAESEPTNNNTSATNVESAPVSNASNDEAVPTNSAVAKGTVASHNINNTNTNNAHKLPQTNEASSHSIFVAIVALLAGLSLMGVDLYRKHNN